MMVYIMNVNVNIAMYIRWWWRLKARNGMLLWVAQDLPHGGSIYGCTCNIYQACYFHTLIGHVSIIPGQEPHFQLKFEVRINMKLIFFNLLIVQKNW